ncbi:hypothetical protein R4Z10_06975 [Niallia sp. XMNu-256]|uniref:hypothetical protein n=1 Tax=Niallia sp. XMNu-256 TaxID=3082444 RepID=UPI0030CCE112
MEEKPTNKLEFGNSDMMSNNRINEDSQITKGKKQHSQRNHVTEAQKQISSQKTVGIPPEDLTSR